MAEQQEAVLSVARRALRFAEQAGATQCEALVQRTDEQLTRFANSEVHQNVSESDTIVNLRFIDGQRVGVASTNRLDDDSLRRLADTAARICRLQPEQPDFAGLPEPGSISMVPGACSAATVEATPEQRAEAARAVISAADEAEVLAYGSYRTVADILGNSEATLRLHYDGRNDTGKRQAIAALELNAVSIAAEAE